MPHNKLLQQVYQLAGDYTLYQGQPDEKRYCLFNVRDGKIFRLNAVSYAMLESFDGEDTVETIATKLSQRFAASVEEIRNDLLAMIAEWTNRGILIPKGGF
ncbi:PqqD family protein [Thermopirellula anaerolimosa]